MKICQDREGDFFVLNDQWNLIRFLYLKGMHTIDGMKESYFITIPVLQKHIIENGINIETSGLNYLKFFGQNEFSVIWEFDELEFILIIDQKFPEYFI